MEHWLLRFMTFFTFSFQKPTLSELEIESNRNGYFWKFWILCFKHYVKCQIFVAKKKKKSHTCEECGAHLRILVWHLLMSRTWKTTIKNLLKWANKKCKTFNIYNVVYIKKKIKRNTRRYHYFTPVYQNSWWYDVQFLRYRVWQTETGNYGSFFALLLSPPKTQKIRILKKWKKLLEISSFYTNLPKTTIIWATVPEIQSDIDKNCCHFRPFFALLPL